jgi:hypothetical protein
MMPITIARNILIFAAVFISKHLLDKIQWIGGYAKRKSLLQR